MKPANRRWYRDGAYELAVMSARERREVDPLWAAAHPQCEATCGAYRCHLTAGHELLHEDQGQQWWIRWGEPLMFPLAFEKT